MGHQTNNPRRMTSIVNRVANGSNIPMPHKFIQPPTTLAFNAWSTTTVYQPQGINGRLDNHQIRSNTQPQPPLLLLPQIEANRLSLKEQFDTLATQVKSVEMRLVTIEDIQHHQRRGIKEAKYDIINANYKIKDQWNHHEWLINEAKQNVEELTTHLNLVAINAYQAKKGVSDVGVAQKKLRLRVKNLEADSRITIQTLNGVEHRQEDLVERITTLEEDPKAATNLMKKLDDRLQTIEETARFFDSEKEDSRSLVHCCTITMLEDDDDASSIDLSDALPSPKRSKTFHTRQTARMSVKPSVFVKGATKRSRCINDEMLGVFNSLVKELPSTITFDEAWIMNPSLR
ncbi:hypothetical protein AALP_AAs72921U000100 [Arabis alpina]|uniref:Uncharacterized protein n=1 Tax=Arabis alpina TaxID=50452 RepID=A0A087G0F3_ARAAL|nr:hypothetical protein AALP_AAs72921U000100 [Arabis alpina]